MTGPGTGLPDEDATLVIARIGADPVGDPAAAPPAVTPGSATGTPLGSGPSATSTPLGSGPSATSTPLGSGPSASEGMRTASTTGVVRAGSTMAVATLVSRVTGFVAKVVLVAFLGFGAVNDSYSLANTLPNIVFELLIGGVLTSVAIPLLSRARADRDGGQRYTQQLMSMAIVALLLATGAALAAAPLLTRLYFGSSDQALTTHLAYLLLPQIFFYGIAALFGAILNTNERFAAPAWAPVINNLVVIGVGAMLLVLPGSAAPGGQGLTTLTTTQFLLLGGGTTAGIVMQALVLLPALRRSGFRFRWRWGLDARMGEAGRLMAWAIAYTLISQAGYVVTARVARHSQDGFYGLYTYGSLLFQLPYGILGVSLLTAIMPRMSRHAAAGEMAQVKRDMGVANRLSTVALLPVTAAMIALALPLATVTAKYGRVSAASAHMLGITLAAFAIGLLPLAVTLVQMRVFYAMKDGRTPTVINAVMVAVRIPLLLACLALPDEWVVPGLALAMSISYVVGVVVGEAWLRVRFGPMGSGRTVVTVGKVAVASAAGGLVAWFVVDHVLPLTSGTVAQAVVQLIVGGIVGLVVVVALLLLLGVEELDALRRRIPGLAPGPALRSGTPRGPRHGTLVGAARPPTGEQPRRQAEQAAHIRQPERHRQGQGSVTEQQSDRGFGQVPPAPAPPHGDLAGATAGTTAGPAGTTAGPAGTTAGAGADSDATARMAPPDATDPARPSPHAVAANVAPTSFAPGSIVGERYRLVSLVATDAAGNRFWRARDTVLPRDMAVTLMPSTSHTAATVSRTLRAGRLHHIGLPQTLDVGTAGSGGDTAYIVGQWVDGATLSDLLTGGPLDPQVAATLTTKIADAVAEAHRNGIALGAIHPSLVRVNFDGQVRLSHVIAHANATTDADIQAVGALLYLMLTGTWPLAAADGGPDLTPAPTSEGRERPAVEVNPAVPVALSALAERALHPDDPQGIHAVGAITALLRPAAPPGRIPPGGTGGASGTGSGARPDEPAPARVLGPAERKLVKERRVKLSIAGVMLVAFAALIVIVLSSLSNQLMTNITEPIQAGAQQQVLINSAVIPTTTRTVGTSPAPASQQTSGSASGSVISPTTSTRPSTSSAPPAAAVGIKDATVYDPQGTPPKDNTSFVDRAFDNDPNTFWPTWVYKQQFGPDGLKSGVGLLLTLDKAVTPASVTVSTGTPGTTVEVRSASDTNPSLDSTKVLGSATLGTDPVSITLSNAPKSTYLILWITKLAPYQGQSVQNVGQFQSNIAEISVTGS